MSMKHDAFVIVTAAAIAFSVGAGTGWVGRHATMPSRTVVAEKAPVQHQRTPDCVRRP